MEGNGRPPIPMQPVGPELVIRLDPQTGNITVKGPVHDRILCLGLLELAKEAIALSAAKQNKSNILLSPNVPGLKA